MKKTYQLTLLSLVTLSLGLASCNGAVPIEGRKKEAGTPQAGAQETGAAKARTEKAGVQEAGAGSASQLRRRTQARPQTDRATTINSGS